MADQSADDAVKYAGAAGYNIVPTREGNRNVGTDGYPVPSYVPQSSAPAAATFVQPAASPAPNTAPQPTPVSARVNFFPGPRANVD